MLPIIQQIPFDAFDNDALVVYVSSDGTYWSGDKQRWVKDIQEATVSPWYRAKLAIVCGDGHFEIVTMNDKTVVLKGQ